MAAHHPLYLLLRCSNTLLREAARLLAPTGLTPAQFNILNLVEVQPAGVRPSGIATDLVVDPSSATYLVRQMTDLGWLERTADPADRRAYRLRVTAEGQRRLHAARADYLPSLEAITAGLSADALNTFRATLDHLLTNAPGIVEARLAAANTARANEIPPETP